MSDYADLIAAFKAKGGTVQKVEAGARAMDAKTMYTLAHGTDAQREAAARKAATVDGYAAYEREQQAAWAERFGA